MTIDISESQFEKSIELHLLKNGYIKRDPKDFFNKEYVIDSEIFFEFLKNTQKDSWEKLESFFEEDIKEKILQSYQKEVESESLLHVIKKGFTVSGVTLDCLFLKPQSGRDEDAWSQYKKNILSVMRQVVTSEGKKPDMVLCLNGIPVATVELKNPATGQSFENAIRQYKEDRDPKDRLFSFKQGALVHFAVDPNEVHMTTKLQKDKTQFLPFNKGRDEGRGNPDNPNGYKTAYLWEQVWQKDTWIEIISDFVNLQIIEQKHPFPNKENIIFPRYHQLDAVLKLTSSTKLNGAGKNYLIQHSAGSGKSNTIAWLAYKLLRSFDEKDNTIFDGGVIILSDRIVVVNQLGDTVEQFEDTPGTADTMKKSQELAINLKSKRKISTTTQQKFRYVLNYISKVKGKKYAIIIDEAHSSQSSDSRKHVQKVLCSNLGEAEKQEEEFESQQKDITDQIEKEMEIRGQQKTLSYYAFTATPKKKTLKLFGTKISDEDYIPFHVYSMKQAIQEGFILNVLKKYITYERYFKIAKTASEDKVVEGKKASRALLKFIDTHQRNIEPKTERIIEHFREHIQPKIGGQAKAMIVCSSREQVLLYKNAVDEYIKNKQYKGIKSLVAFSGILTDEFGNTFTEQSINEIKTDRELREKFDTPEYNILIVAEKYQTGFDQPLLHTMYVDKKLNGIKAVQTLSRLNRIHAGKTDTCVIDFQNSIDDIYIAFKPYYEGTSLSDKTDQEFIFNLYNMIMNLEIIKESDLEKFAEIFFKDKSEQTSADQGRLYAITNHALTRYIDADEKIQDDFKIKIKIFIESYSFLSQLITYDDTNLEKMFAFLMYIINDDLIQNVGAGLPELKGDVSLEWYKLEKTHEGGILVDSGGGLTMGVSYGSAKPPEVLTSLSEVIRSLNETFRGAFTGGDKISLDVWFEELKNDPILRNIAKANPFKEFLKEFERRFLNIIISSDETNQNLVKRIFSDPELKKELIMGASQIYHGWVKSNGLPPITPSDPARNRQIFRQTIYQCKGSIRWLDLYLNDAGLDFLIDSFDQDKVKELKVITGLIDNEYSFNEKLLNKFKNYQQEFTKKGISLQMKVVATKEGRDRVAHDRYLLGDNVKFNTVAFTLLQKGRFSEIKKTENEIPFDEYWNDPDSYDLVNDWEKINKLSTFNSKCSDCEIEIQLPFKPDGKRPVYCKECLQKHRK